MNTHKRKRTIATVAALLAALAALALSACGGDDDVDPGTDPPDYAPAIAKAPPKLRALYEKGGVLAPGGLEGFSEQLAAVRGFPAVVNNWASWCGPCRTEWPWLQQAAADNLDEVAFIGVDGDDSDDAASTFLDQHPVPYPSFADPDKSVGSEVGATLVGGFPNTLFFDRNGELIYTHQGVYPDQAALEADIRKYALGES
ncbi:MAG: TlpA disulfide reductase family protein [Solirubrobacterales bacterium]